MKMSENDNSSVKKRSYSCNVCKKSFSLLNKLTQHKKVHESDLEYKCSACGKSFAQKHILDVHIARKHIEEKPHGCEWCSKAFATVYDLQRHIKTHTGLKPHKCDSCVKALSTSGDLVRHKRIHTGEKPYKCEVCARPFSRIGSCLRHQKTHSKGKKHRCDICNKEFTRPWNLLVHKRTHTEHNPHYCDICTKSFSLLHELQSHKKIHVKTKKTIGFDRSISSTSTHSVKDKTHNCGTCSKEFRNKHDMQQHVKSCKESVSRQSNNKAKNRIRHSRATTELGIGSINVPTATISVHDVSLYTTKQKGTKTHGKDRSTSGNLAASSSNDKGTTHQCVECHNTFYQKQSRLEQYKLRCDKCTINDRADNSSYSVDQTRIELDDIFCDTAYVCSLCGVSFKTNILLNNHITDNHEK